MIKAIFDLIFSVISFVVSLIGMLVALAWLGFLLVIGGGIILVFTLFLALI